jgi:hypothetical protein
MSSTRGSAGAKRLEQSEAVMKSRTVDEMGATSSSIFGFGGAESTDGRLMTQNRALARALADAREQIAALREEVDKLSAPPSSYGVYLSANADGTLNVLAAGRKVKVNRLPSIAIPTLRPGQELVLNEGMNVVETAGYEIQGEVVVVKTLLDEERVVVTLRADEDRVALLSDPLRDWRRRSRRSRMRSSCPTCTPNCTGSTGWRPPGACCCTVRPAAARP